MVGIVVRMIGGDQRTRLAELRLGLLYVLVLDAD